MSIKNITQKYDKAQLTTQVVQEIKTDNKQIGIPNLVGSALSFFIQAVYKQTEKPFLLIFTDKEQAAYYLNDLEQLLGEKNLLFFPGSYRRPYQIEEVDNANILLRTEVLNRINSRKKPSVIVTYPDALFEQVITKAELGRNTMKLHVGDELSLDFINEVLFEYHFEKVDFVSQPGEFAVRGGIIDVFSYSHEEPYRIEFFGDDIDSIRTFDVETQLSSEKLSRISIVPNVTNKHTEEKRQSFLEYISRHTLVWTQNTPLLYTRLDKLFDKAKDAFKELDSLLDHAEPNELFIDGEKLKQDLAELTSLYTPNATVKTSRAQVLSQQNTIHKTLPQPAFNKHFDLLIKNLQENTEKGIANYLFCDNEKQAKRFHDIFSNKEEEIQYKTLVFPLYQGFIDTQLKIACYTDHQIFERYHKFRLKTGFKRKQALTLKELTSLQIGDYVTHIDHGIGKFGGLQKIDVEGKKQEAIKLIYADRDILYISIHSLHKITRFNGKDGSAPKIYKLGTGAWKKLKQKTKTKVKKIAFDLIELYAKRRMQKGYQYRQDSAMQHELEASFMYEETPDQYKAIQDVKDDMESERPMDRLVCGDVGFGKTEVAMRAAFKAVDNDKQVAILVPTTILAFQHFRSFQKRFQDFPVTVDYLNRFRTAKQRNEVLKSLENGSLDVVIGTHQLVSKNVKFKKLGLLIIDEEQKFGVGIKDKLKTIKENVDTLTLTATPIPRTLQFSLMAARDLSLINTPPPNRQPIETQIIRFNQELIRDALQYEISRGGQVFFIHNRIENIKEVAGMLQRLLPDATIGIGHGRMEGKKLEKLMLAFINNEFDILVSTTIVENGLDVPNANTIFINNANNFGLSDLHQMRGRVGRSNKKAFCYLITPSFHAMTDDARKRVQAIQQFSDLGSGFGIAMKDLEIRGAGDLLGGEQSGFINDIGFETYQKILREAIDELKETEFKTLFNTDEDKEKTYVKDVQIDTDLELLIPDNYVSIIAERLSLYTDLGSVENATEMEIFKKNLIDRFGDLPKQVSDLLLSVELKWQAKKMGLEKVVLKRRTMIGYFISNQQSEFYNTEIFIQIMNFASQNPTICSVKEKMNKKGLRLLIRFEGVTSVTNAIELLKNVIKE